MAVTGAALSASDGQPKLLPRRWHQGGDADADEAQRAAHQPVPGQKETRQAVNLILRRNRVFHADLPGQRR